MKNVVFTQKKNKIIENHSYKTEYHRYYTFAKLNLQ